MVVSYLSFLSYQKNSYDRYNHMETSHTTAQCDRYDIYNVLSEIELILSPITDTTGNGHDTTAFCKWKPPQATHTTDTTQMCPNIHFVLPLLWQQKQQIRQIQQYGNTRYLTVVWVVFALQGASFTRQKWQIQLYGNQAILTVVSLQDQFMTGIACQ